jgi:hypothetical protein
MNPTHYELATVAAAMSRAGDTPSCTVSRALDLWNACGTALANAAKVAAHCEDHAQRITAKLAPLEGLEPYTLEKLLRAAMPNSKPEDRAKKYRDYLRRNFSSLHGWSGEELESRVADSIQREKAGMDRLSGEITFIGFARYVETERQRLNAERGRKGAAAKKESTTKKISRRVPESVKTPQVRRKPTQAKR